MEKDNLLKKAAEDMKFYKLELLNREKNYNKVFGANPNIGVMDPRDFKVGCFAYAGRAQQPARERDNFQAKLMSNAQQGNTAIIPKENYQLIKGILILTWYQVK